MRCRICNVQSSIPCGEPVTFVWQERVVSLVSDGFLCGEDRRRLFEQECDQFRDVVAAVAGRVVVNWERVLSLPRTQRVRQFASILCALQVLSEVRNERERWQFCDAVSFAETSLYFIRSEDASAFYAALKKAEVRILFR